MSRVNYPNFKVSNLEHRRDGYPNESLPQCLLLKINVHLVPIGHLTDQSGNKSVDNALFFKRNFGDPRDIRPAWIFEECSV